jgi:hypothetical protein
MKSNTPPKYKDPDGPTIFIVIGKYKVRKAMFDLGGSVDFLPYLVFKQLGFGELKLARMPLQLDDRSVKIPRGIVRDVLILIDIFYFFMDFVVSRHNMLLT